MRKFFIEYFNYSSKELKPLYYLVILLLLSIIIRSGMTRQELNEHAPDYEIMRKNQAFIENLKSRKTASSTYYESESESENNKAIQPYFFDPNTIEAKQLKDFGLNGKTISNICKYRAAGGRFLNPIDMKKIYGLDEEVYNYIEKWIAIKPFTSIADSSHNKKDYSTDRDSVVDFELNSINYKDLIKLTGGNAKLAGRILNYRNLLGGYYSKSQLWEVFDMTDTVFNAIYSASKIDTLLIVALSLNNSAYSDLLRHPYLGKENVNLMLKYRKFKNSNIDFNDFLKSKIFPDSTLQKMRPYLKN